MDLLQTKQKLSHPISRDDIEDAGAGPSNVESSPKIFKLSIDCMDEIFEYLSLKDLHSFGQTCKRMNKVAGEYFKQNYSSVQAWCKGGVIYTYYADKDGVKREWIDISGFSQFTPSISISNILSYIQSHVSEFGSVKRFSLDYFKIDNETIKFINRLLGQLEMVELFHCSIDGDLYHLMLQHCGNPKKLCVRHYKFKGRSIDKYKWLLHTYPKLEHLHLSGYEGTGKIEELRTFFERNPNVNRFSFDFDSFWDNRKIFLNSKAKLDVLDLGGSQSLHRTNLRKYLKLLNELHAQGFYKRIYINTGVLDMDLSTFLVSLKGIESLAIGRFNNIYNLHQLTNLTALKIGLGYESNVADMELLANSLVKLERLYIKNYKSVDFILPFVCHSLKLNKIKVNSSFYNDGAMNLKMLNEERTKLAGARKVLIYATDDIFLSTKWETKNGDTNLNLIEIRRWALRVCNDQQPFF